MEENNEQVATNPSNDTQETALSHDAKNNDPAPMINENQDSISMQKKSFIGGHLFLIISFIIFLALAGSAIFLLKDKVNLESKTSTSVTSKKATSSIETVKTPAIPIEDDVVNPPAPPTE